MGKTMLKSIVILFFATALNAREVTFTKKVTLHVLEAELRSKGFQIIRSGCVGENLDRCTILMPDSETKDPSTTIAAHVYVDPDALRRARLAELHALEKKDDAGPISAVSAKRMRKLMLILSGLSGGGQ